MNITINDADGVTIARLSGRLDTANVNQVEQSFTSTIVPKGQHTVVDLTEVSFIASLGIRMLLTVARALGRNRAQFVLFGAAPIVMEILETTAISEIIPVFGTEAEALTALSA